MEPLTFHPLYMQRVWGGRKLESIYHRKLPEPGIPYGESWEIVDRQNAQSIVDAGPYAGMSLHTLWSHHREEIFGTGFQNHPRFPILIKVLDARDDLSIQVHPPAHLAASLGGEPKTEMWFIADCDPGAKLYVGLRNGITQTDFEQAVTAGSVAEVVHAITPQAGESIFIASGRLHAIGAGFLIHEIQQNSDTTYRVFDWNRLGLDQQPRDLHVAESLASIDFSDFEPEMDTPVGETLAACEFFKTDKKSLLAGQTFQPAGGHRFSIISIVHGTLESNGGQRFHKGKFIFLPLDCTPLKVLENSVVLQITLPT